ncbi:MAG: ATP-binding cassette domain-containing protein [Candidatus Heimdallarchaeota archaeon]|nr:ATP-binding cassette domain-containing protein [Candidatus Heimdallarchaeota archaeon]
MENYLDLQNICKYYYTDDGVVIKANDNVNFTLKKGEVHALLGENGAGKSTVVRNLSRRPDSGIVLIEGKEVIIKNPLDSMNFGIGISHQNLSKSLVDRHTISENILSVAKGRLFSIKKINQKIKSAIEKYGLDDIDPNMKVWKLSGGEKQRVEILKAIITDPNILILDEPTSMLTPLETEKLFTLTANLKKQNKSVIIITHHLDEAINHCDRITVMRQGQVVETLDEAQVEKFRQDPDAGVRTLANLMVGKEVIYEYEREDEDQQEKIEVVNVSNLSVANDMGDQVVRSVDLVINEGEILGLAGIGGNGQQQLVEALLNIRSKISGKITIRNTDITDTPVKKIRNLGVAYIPEDRQKGMISELSIGQNLLLNSYDEKSGLFINTESAVELIEGLMEKYAIKAPNSLVSVSSLSGGNKQKVVVARELSKDYQNGSLFVIAENPTIGLDVQTTQFVRQQLLNKRQEGAGILLVSSDLSEILAIADYIAVMYNGRIIGHISRNQATKDDIGLMMGGVNPYEQKIEEEI